MFWGCKLTSEKEFFLKNNKKSRTLHLTAASLGPATSTVGKTFLQIEVDQSDKLVIAVLDHETNSQKTLDLRFEANQNITFSVSGQGEVSITGFYERKGDLSDDDLLLEK